MMINQSLQHARIQKNLSLQELALRVGTNKSQIDKLEKGERRLTVEWLVKLADALELSPAMLLEFPLAEDAAPMHLADPAHSDYAPGPARSSNQLPIRGIYDFKQHIASHMHSVSGSTPCPPGLYYVNDAYGVYMHNDSMYPRYQLGDILYVNPHKPLSRGCYVVICMQDNSGCIARFESRDQQILVLTTLSPCREQHLPIAEIKSIHRIVGCVEA